MPKTLPARRPRHSRRIEACLALGSAFAMPLSFAQAGAVGPATPVVAGAPLNFALPPAPLAATLRAIADRSGVAIRADAAALGDHVAGAIGGEMTARQAVVLAIRGTGLTVTEAADGSLAVGPAQLTAVLVTARRDPAETSFKADRSDTATRSGTDLMDVPGSVTIITARVLESEQATTLRETLRNVSGVNFKESPQGAPTYTVRGFAETSVTVNGVTDTSAAQTNVVAVERVEVLKGPQAILSGAASLGGGVNVVLKRPSAEPVREATAQLGTHADKTLAADFSGPLSEDKKLTYRVVASVARATTNDAGYNGRKDDFLMPELRWKDVSTDLTVGVSSGEQHLGVPRYTFARRDGAILPPPAQRPGNEGDGFDFRQKRAFYELEQGFGGDLTLVSRLQYTSALQFLHLYTPFGLNYDAGAAPDRPNGSVFFLATPDRQTYATTSGDHYLRAKIVLGELAQKLSVGVNHSDYQLQQVQFSGGTTLRATLYPATPVTFPDVEAANRNVSSVANGHDVQRGAFIQDLLTWGDWNLLLNFRRTLYSQSGDLTTYFRGRARYTGTPKLTVGHDTPGAGLVYTVDDRVSLYASYAEGFLVNSSIGCDGGLVPPILTKNKEAGAKFQFFDRKLSLTSALYQLEQSNTLVYDSIGRCYNVRASTRTTGVELDAQGELSRGWNALLNYTYSTIEDVGDATNLYPGNPKHKVNLWTTYDLPWAAVRGLGIGLGASAQSWAQGTTNVDAPFVLPGQAQFDATLFWRRPAWDVSLGVKNLADRRLYGDSNSAAYVPILPGRTFLVTVKHRFD